MVNFCFQNCSNLNFACFLRGQNFNLVRFRHSKIASLIQITWKKGIYICRFFFQIWFNPSEIFCDKYSGDTAFLRPPFTENTNLLGVGLNHVTQIAELSHILTRPIYWVCTYLLMSFWSNLAGNSNLLEYEAIRGKNLDFFHSDFTWNQFWCSLETEFCLSRFHLILAILLCFTLS